jgi:probable HAF family extracellular repeat protein
MTTLTMKGELKTMIALTSMMLVLGSLALPGAQAEQAPAREKPRITVTEIEALRGDSVQVTSLNDRGVIVGAKYFADIDRTVPISWNPRDGVEKVVGDLPGAQNGVATDINNRGSIVGYVLYDDIPSGFLWTEADGFIDLGSFVPNAINDRGQMAGSCFEGSLNVAPCFWEDGSVSDLRDGAPYGGAFGINDRGEVVGQVGLSAFVWSPRTGTVRLPTELPGQSIGYAGVINNRGLIAGFRSPGVARELALWTRDGDLEALPINEAAPQSINDSGWVVGWYITSAMVQHAFALTDDREFIDLGPSFAWSINKSGDILGTTRDGEQRVVIWHVAKK